MGITNLVLSCAAATAAIKRANRMMLVRFMLSLVNFTIPDIVIGTVCVGVSSQHPDLSVVLYQAIAIAGTKITPLGVHGPEIAGIPSPEGILVFIGKKKMHVGVVPSREAKEGFIHQNQVVFGT
jgi:hypothetical protein